MKLWVLVSVVTAMGVAPAVAPAPTRNNHESVVRVNHPQPCLAITYPTRANSHGDKECAWYLRPR